MSGNIEETYKGRTKKKVSTPQGERFKKLRISLGYFRKSSFAKTLKTSHATISAIEDSGRPISDNIINSLTERFEDFNPDWLLSGRGHMLKSEYQQEGHFSIVKDDQEKSYQHICEECRKKDLKIMELQEELDKLRKEYIECLKDLSGLRKSSG